jgi:hypothetical protein
MLPVTLAIYKGNMSPEQWPTSELTRRAGSKRDLSTMEPALSHGNARFWHAVARTDYRVFSTILLQWL